MNHILALLIRATTSEDEENTLLTVARRTGLLWHCEPCRQDGIGGHPCWNCGATAPATTPEAPALTVIPLVSAVTATTVAVFDDEHHAAALAERLNTGRGTPLVEVGAGLPHNPPPADREIIEHLTERATGEATPH